MPTPRAPATSAILLKSSPIDDSAIRTAMMMIAMAQASDRVERGMSTAQIVCTHATDCMADAARKQKGQHHDDQHAQDVATGNRSFLTEKVQVGQAGDAQVESFGILAQRAVFAILTGPAFVATALSTAARSNSRSAIFSSSTPPSHVSVSCAVASGRFQQLSRVLVQTLPVNALYGESLVFRFKLPLQFLLAEAARQFRPVQRIPFQRSDVGDAIRLQYAPPPQRLLLGKRHFGERQTHLRLDQHLLLQALLRASLRCLQPRLLAASSAARTSSRATATAFSLVAIRSFSLSRSDSSAVGANLVSASSRRLSFASAKASAFCNRRS